MRLKFIYCPSDAAYKFRQKLEGLSLSPAIQTLTHRGIKMDLIMRNRLV